MEKSEYQLRFGERLKQVRVKSGLTQKQFAERIKSSQSTVVRLEAGTRMAEAFLVEQIADQFGCNVEWLVTGKGRSGLK